MNVLFTGLYPYWNYHFVSELNFMEMHFKDNDNLFILECNESLKSCEANPGHDLGICLKCIGVRQHCMKLLSGKIKSLPLIIEELRIPRKYKKFNSINQLRNDYVDGYNIGQAVYSSLVEREKNISPPLKKNNHTIKKLFYDSLKTFISVKKHIVDNKIDLVYIFNGRFAAARACVEACNQLNIPFYTHEKLSSVKNSMRYYAKLPHDIKQYPSLIEEFWIANKKNLLILNEAHEFYSERPKGLLTGWTSFVESQDETLFPNNWDSKKRNIIIYSSSEFEIAGTDEFIEKKFILNQLKTYSELIKAANSESPNLHFYLRIHPNSINDSIKWWLSNELTEIDNLDIIPPDSKISSYLLLKNSNCVVSLCSTMAVEATYWGKPSVVLGEAFYSGLKAVYEANSIEEAVNLFTSETIIPMPQENALKFGAFMRCGGDELTHSTSINFSALTFKGIMPDTCTEVNQWIVEKKSMKPRIQFLKSYLERKRYNSIIKICDGDLSFKR